VNGHSTFALFLRTGVVGVTVGLIASLLTVVVGTLIESRPASAASGSEVTVTAAAYNPNDATAPMPDLAVTVSQTRDLAKQGITVSWTGGATPSSRPSGTGGSNFLQIFQCWGEDRNNPGHPDRTTCQYGGFAATAASRDASVDPEDVLPQDEDFTVPGAGYFNPPYTSIPFRAVTGKTISSIITENGVKRHDGTVDVNSNEFFTQYTTNEIKWAGSGDDGTGAVKFEVQTQMESPGLGCGTPTIEGNTVTGAQSCWLVVLPRGTADNGQNYITKSGLFWDSWQHALAVKLDFRPIGVRCQIGAAEKQIAGSEMISQAISMWQPELCLQQNGAAFVVRAGDESDAVFDASTTTPSALALTSRAMAADASDPNVYAPVAISGVCLAFNIDRRVLPDSSVPTEVTALNYTPFDKMNLTPRLVAKLLTASYISALPGGADLGYMNYHGSDNPGPNSTNLTKDPDFLAVNDDEWQYMDINSTSVADALVPQGRSDLAYQMWNYVLSDPEAVAFLNGAPDRWGMKVNPWYSTNAAINPSGVALTLPRTNFPKADPVEKPDATTSDPVNGTGPINLVAWRPYVQDFETGAYDTLRADGLVLGAWNRDSVPPKFGKLGRYLLGEQKNLTVTTTGAAAKFQTIPVALKNPAGNFVVPTRESMAAAVSAMTPSVNSHVYEFNFGSDAAKAASNAYPLTMPIYAAMNPLQTDAALRATYATFIRYAAQNGQTPGTQLGQLPEGYAPLPASWVSQAMSSASAIQAGVKPTAPVDLGGLPAGNYAPRVGGSSAEPAPTVTPSGAPAGALSSSATPVDPIVGPVAAAVPIGLSAGVLAAAGVPLYTRWRRNDV
jgi:hypothetical protein